MVRIHEGGLLVYTIHMNNFLKEFKTFAMKGNVMDLAIGVIIGAAFGKIVSSLVDNVFMPIIGAIIGGKNVDTSRRDQRPTQVKRKCAALIDPKCVWWHSCRN